MSGGSSSEKGFGTGRGKGEGRDLPFVWEGSLGPDFFGEAMHEFSVVSKSDFTKENLLRGYDNCKED
jgi:hypothetical protein